ncbi:MAG: hypothetical protein FWC64_06045 [Treponema sp.]|nr:hypothetical protein [Treponema sp.]
MRDILEVLIFAVIGVILLWVGYTLFFSIGIPVFGGGKGFRLKGPGKRGKRGEGRPGGEGTPGDPQTCPVCSAKLGEGQLVSSLAFPSLNGGKDRFMHIRGCLYCLQGKRSRLCPVCTRVLKGDEILVCRLFQRSRRKSHVHVMGCTRCKGPNSGRRL